MDVSLTGLFSLSGLFTLAMLILLQAVLGFDNLLYISIESKRVEESKQSYVRKMGVGLAIFLRIGLLIVLLLAISKLQTPFLTFGLEPEAASLSAEGGSGDPLKHPANDHTIDHEHPNFTLTSNGKICAASINVHSLVVLIGGIFIIYTAFKEIMHMLHIHERGEKKEEKPRSVNTAIFWIVLMNLVFSFDSILSAIALTKNVWVMTVAIIVSGVLMIVMADTVSDFLKKNRMYEVLGLFILFIVGILLVSEGAHLAHIHIFQYEIQPMAKATFYFVIAILVMVDVIQSRYQKKLLAEKQKLESAAH
ncbi:MAG: tellurium resistance protein TerC [Planctomycetota bacterium]